MQSLLRLSVALQRTAIIACIVLFSGCAQSHVNQLGWLSGTWSSEHNGLRTTETWSRPTTKSMAGFNVVVQVDDGHVSFVERLRIELSGGRVVYLAQPGLQEHPTPFYLVEAGDHHAVFENPDHDFPQRIIYRRDGDTLHARIEGDLGGEPRWREWTWQRDSE